MASEVDQAIAHFENDTDIVLLLPVLEELQARTTWLITAARLQNGSVPPKPDAQLHHFLFSYRQLLMMVERNVQNHIALQDHITKYRHFIDGEEGSIWSDTFENVTPKRLVSENFGKYMNLMKQVQTKVKLGIEDSSSNDESSSSDESSSDGEE